MSRIFLRKIVRKYFSADISKSLKQFEFKTKRSIVKALPSISKRQFREILQDKLKVKVGDNLFIHASSSMMNLGFTTKEMAEIIRECVGDGGLIIVPTFPRTSSQDFLKNESVFDALKERSGMGVLSEYIRTMPGSSRSNHPTKSMAGVGPGIRDLLLGHEKSEFSFDSNSPYYKLLDRDIKIIGLGAQMSYLSFVHVPEDCNPATWPVEVYQSTPIRKNVKLEDGRMSQLRYYAHDLDVVSKANPEKFVRRNMDKNSYTIYRHFLTPFFVVDGNILFQSIQEKSPLETIYY